MSEIYLHRMQQTFSSHVLRPALVHEQRVLSYGDLLVHAREQAGWRRSLGVRPGARVVLCTGNKRAFLLAHLATLFAGAVSLPLNPRFTREELRFFLGDSGAHTAIVGDESHAIIESLRPELPRLQNVIGDAAVLDLPKGTYPTGRGWWGCACTILYNHVPT